MIIVFHDRVHIKKVIDFKTNQELACQASSIQKALLELALNHPNTFVGWCHYQYEKYIDIKAVSTIFHHKLIMASFSVSKNYSVPPAVGYVEDSTFLKIEYDVCYPTWLMSSDIGGIHAQVLIQFKKLANHKMSFDVFLNQLAKQGIKKGLFCYSDPRLFKQQPQLQEENKNTANLFSFVKNNYRSRWIFILFFDYWIYEKKMKLWEFIKALIKPEFRKDVIDFTPIIINSSFKHDSFDTTYDVLIPTLGRAKYLKDVLLDLCEHTILPKTIIIVEQNALPESESELDYIYDREWPFEIDHTFTHQLGACNARNIALTKIKSSWVFFADDDIRISKTLIENAFKFIKQYGASALNMASLRKDEMLAQTFPIQWYAFSTNSSFVKASVIKDIRFGMEHEFGFGEDSDYGMKIRNKGVDIIFYPNSEIIHLKAPIGGFRAKVTLPWDGETIQPKPSPMVLAHRVKHTTKEQLLGFKTILFYKFFKVQKNKNPFSYIKEMSKRWERSMYWTNQLIEKHHPNEL